MIKNKKHIVTILGLILGLLILTQCETLWPNNKSEYSTIKFGESISNLDVQTIDSLIAYKIPGPYPFGNGSLEYSVDIDRDEKPDFIFSNYKNVTKWGTWSKTSIQIINSKFEIAVQEKTDTVFSCGYVDYANPEYPLFDTVFFTVQSEFTCLHTTEIKEILTNVYPEFRYIDENLVPESDWYKESLLIIKDYTNFRGESMFIEFEFRFNYKRILGLEPSKQMQYISIRANEEDGYRYGWIKIGIENEYSVYLYETALEKEIALEKSLIQ